jgi:fluoride exporter
VQAVSLSTYVWIACGGALGSVLRFFCVEWVQLRWASFPWGTLLVNVIGSGVIGLVAALSSSDSRIPLTPELRQFVIVGVLGGFTTFSSFSLQTLMLMRGGAWFSASANVVGSITLCLLTAWLGLMLGNALAK